MGGCAAALWAGLSEPKVMSPLHISMTAITAVLYLGVGLIYILYASAWLENASSKEINNASKWNLSLQWTLYPLLWWLCSYQMFAYAKPNGNTSSGLITANTLNVGFIVCV